MTNVTYSYNRPYYRHRPYADVTLLAASPGHQNFNFTGLVDTGADYLQLPLSAATAAGLPIGSATAMRVRGVTGQAIMHFLRGVAVAIEGKRVIVDAIFDPVGSSSALLGRQALLAAVEAGFNAHEWLWEL